MALVRGVMAVLLPAKTRRKPLMLETVNVGFHLPLAGHVEQIQFVPAELVAGQGIRAALELGSPASFGR
jgi:hypothetical protein